MVAGIIPHLMALMSNKSSKQFALSMLCDVGHLSKVRAELWKHSLLDSLLALLAEDFWCVGALDAICSWLHDETAKVEEVLVQSANISRLVKVFEESSVTSFGNLVEPYLDLVKTSAEFARRIVSDAEFIALLLDRLKQSKSVMVRVGLVKLLNALQEHQTITAEHIAKYKLKSVLEQLQSDQKVLIQEIATQMLEKIA